MTEVTPGDVYSLVPRFRWGNIAPRSGIAVDLGPGYEFYRLCPLDVIEIKVELGITEYTEDAVEAAISRFPDKVDLLAREQSDRIILGGAPVSARLGRTRVRALLDEASERTGIACDAPLEAVISTMQHLGLERLALASRWSADLNDAVAAYLRDGGVQVVARTERDQWASDAAAMTLEEGIAMALDVAREAARTSTDSEAVFVAGGAAMSIQTIPVIEAEFGLPTFTNFSAEVFTGLVGPGVIEPLTGWGALLAGK